MDRRSFLALALLGATSRSRAQDQPTPQRLRFPPPVQPPPRTEPFTQPLRLPGADGVMAELRLDRAMQFTAKVQPIALLDGPPTLVWHYETEHEGRVLRNPFLRVRRGERVTVRLSNRLEEATTIHWHGLNVDERNDGSGLHPVPPRADYAYDFVANNPSGLYWYHAHPHYRTGYQVHKGMAGALLIEDEHDDALRAHFDLRVGETELPLIIQDKQFGLRNELWYESGEDDWIGNRVLVNLVPEPRHVVQRRGYRLRLLNASNARPYRLAFRVGERSLPFVLIGTDGGLLERAIDCREVFLAPAQRIDVLIDFSSLAAGTRVALASLAYDPMENDGAAPVDPHLEHPGATPMGEALTVMVFDVAEGKARPMPRPPRRLGGEVPKARDGKVDRRFRIHIDNGRWLINGRNHHDDHDAPRFDVTRGTREVWEFTNDTRSMPHPMHTHAFRFRVLERRDSPPQFRALAVKRAGLIATDLGWQDTVLVWPGERVRVAIDFSQPFRGPQTYMLHCHNLEHEDQGLMLNYRVNDA